MNNEFDRYYEAAEPGGGADKSGEWYFESVRSQVFPASKSSKLLTKPIKERGEKEERTGLHKKGEV